MIRPEQIPDEAWIAFKNFILQNPYGYDYRKALAAALNAWPNWYGTWDEDATGVYRTIILPLPKEGADE